MSSESPSLNFDILIVGSGIVGSTVACALAVGGRDDPQDNALFHPLKIALIDRVPFDKKNLPAQQQPLCFDPRVSAITVASEKLFRDIGVWDQMQKKRISPYREMHVWEQDGTGSIHFSCDDINEPVLGHIIENSVILNALMDRIDTSNNVEIISPASVTGLLINSTDCSVELQLADQRKLKASLLIAADGAASKVRELARFTVKQWDYQQHAIVTTVRTELPHNQTAIQRFMDDGPLAFLPLNSSEIGDEAQYQQSDHQHYSSIVWSTSLERAAELMEMTDAEFSSILQTNIESRLGEIQELHKRYSFPLRQSHATHYVKEGIALVGDAAHSIHPLAGQGVNLGLLDSAALVAEIKDACSKGIRYSDLRILRRYQRTRIGHNLAMMWLMEGFKRLFSDQPLPVRWLRNVGMSRIDKLAVVKNEIMRRAMGGSQRF